MQVIKIQIVYCVESECNVKFLHNFLTTQSITIRRANKKRVSVDINFVACGS